METIASKSGADPQFPLSPDPQSNFIDVVSCTPGPARMLLMAEEDAETRDSIGSSSGLGTSASSVETTDNTDESQKRYYCQRCLNHRLEFPRKGHKPYCKYANCNCEDCIMVEKRRLLNNQLSLRKLDPNAPRPEPGKKKVRAPKCARCSAHNERMALRGHKRTLCPFRECKCYKCGLVEERRMLMARQIKLRRDQQKARNAQLAVDEIEKVVRNTIDFDISQMKTLKKPKLAIKKPKQLNTRKPKIQIEQNGQNARVNEENQQTIRAPKPINPRNQRLFELSPSMTFPIFPPFIMPTYSTASLFQPNSASFSPTLVHTPASSLPSPTSPQIGQQNISPPLALFNNLKIGNDQNKGSEFSPQQMQLFNFLVAQNANQMSKIQFNSMIAQSRQATSSSTSPPTIKENMRIQQVLSPPTTTAQTFMIAPDIWRQLSLNSNYQMNSNLNLHQPFNPPISIANSSNPVFGNFGRQGAMIPVPCDLLQRLFQQDRLLQQLAASANKN